MGSRNIEALEDVSGVVGTDRHQRASKASHSEICHLLTGHFCVSVYSQATSRLLTLTSFPQRSMLGYGARYLQDYFSVWVGENGGYVCENAPE